MSNILSEANQKLIFWLATASITLFGVLGTIYDSGIQSQFSSQQIQIDDNRNKIWEQQRVAVTEDSLTRRLADVMLVVDSRIEGIQSLQKEQSRQLELLIQSQSAFQRDVRDALNEKVNKQ